MEVWYLQSIMDGEKFDKLLLHVPQTDIWIEGFEDLEYLEVINWTPLFWKEVVKEQTEYLIRIGDL